MTEEITTVTEYEYHASGLLRKTTQTVTRTVDEDDDFIPNLDEDVECPDCGEPICQNCGEHL